MCPAYSDEEMTALNIPQINDNQAKFGASVTSGKMILQKAKELKLNVIGVR